MLTAAILLVAIVFVLQVVRKPAGDETDRALDTGERYYAMAATLPLLLCFAAPGVLSLVFGEEPSARLWSTRLTNAGLWLSLGLTLIGAALLYRANRKHGSAPGRLAAGVGLAAFPAFLVVVVISFRLLA